MKYLTFGVVALALLWAGFWVWASSAQERAFRIWFETQNSAGWVAEYDNLATSGFPNRLDTRIEGLFVADTQGGLAYRAEFLHLFSLSYKPDHIIAVWPEHHSIATPHLTAQITNDDLRASIILDGGTPKGVLRSNLAAQNVSADLGEGTIFSAARLNMALAKVDGKPSTYHLGLDSQELTLPRPAGLDMNLRQLLPKTMAYAKAEVLLELDKPLDTDALSGPRPQPKRLGIKRADAKWGKLELKIAGDLEIDARGMATGDLVIKAENWRDILDLVAASALVPQNLQRLLEQGLGLLGTVSGRTNSLDIALNIDGGRVKLGPLPLGTHPPIRWP